MGENRKYIRLPVDLEVRFTHDKKEYLGKMLNISTGGTFLKAPKLFDPNDILDLSFHLPGGDEPLNVIGKVAWGGSIEGAGLTAFGMGVHFENLTPSVKEEIDLFIRHLLKA